MIDFGFIIHPKESAIAHAKNANVKNAIIRYFLVGFILSLAFNALFPPIPFLRQGSGTVLTATIVSALVAGVGCVLIGLIAWFIFTKLVIFTGTKSNFVQNFYVGSQMFVPTMLISAVLFLAGVIFSPLVFIFAIWQIWNAYVHVAAASATNKISMMKAFGLILITVVLLLILSIIALPVYRALVYATNPGIGSMAGSAAANPFR